MAKKLSGIHRLLLSIIFPAFVELGADEFTKWMDKVFIEDSRLVTMLLAALYPFIDVYLEKYALQTKTKYDDEIVQSLKRTIETFAASKGIALENRDED